MKMKILTYFQICISVPLNTCGLVCLPPITYLNITKTVHPTNSKNLPWTLYATTAHGFSTMPLLILLKMC